MKRAVGSWLRAGELDSDGSFGSYAIYNPDNSEKLVAAYKEELDRFIKDGLTEDELKDAKSGFLQGRSRSRSDDEYLVDKLTKFIVLNRAFNWDDIMDKNVTNLTTAQVNAAVKKWLHPEKIIIVQAGDFDKKKN